MIERVSESGYASKLIQANEAIRHPWVEEIGVELHSTWGP
jgi:hypothetical protein